MSCKKGNPEGVPLDNKCNNTNITNQCEINYKIDPFKSTNCIPKKGFWYIGKYNYIMNSHRCPDELPYIIYETNQCVSKCDNKSEYSYNGTFYYINESESSPYHLLRTYCVVKCPPKYKFIGKDCKNKAIFIHYYIYYALFLTLFYML